MPRSRLVPFGLLIGLITMIGCNRGPKFAEVEGTLKFNGKPLDRIQVEFWPEVKGPRSIGETDKDGRYTLTSDDGKSKGAVVGKHRIVLRDVGILGDKFLGRAGENVDMTKGKPPRIPDHYSDAEKTPLRKDVTSGKNVIDLDAKP